jgi:D-xylonolactonase
VPATGRPEVLDGPVHELAEQPVWCPGRGLLAWVDLEGGSAWTARPGERPTLLCRTDLGASGIVAVPGHPADWYVADGVTVRRCDGSGRTLDVLPLSAVDEGLDSGGWRLNGIGTDPVGRLWAGLFATPAGRARGGLRRLDDGRRAPWVTAASNGFTWDAGGVCWHVDTLDRLVHRGVLHRARQARGVPIPVPADLPGRPDGLAVVAPGSVRVAMWDGGCLVDIDADGRVLRRTDLPVSRPTAMCPHPAGGWVVTTARVPGEELSGRLLHLL